MVSTLSLQQLSNIYARQAITALVQIKSLENAQLATTQMTVGCLVLNVPQDTCVLVV